MSDYHILLKSVDNRNATVCIHLPIPSTQTVAGAALADATLTYQRALKESLTGLEVTVIPNHATDFPVENALLVNGEVFEKVISFRFSSLALTNLERRGEIEDGNPSGTEDPDQIGVIQMKVNIAIAGTDLYDEILEPLAWWGYYRDTP